MKNIAGSSKSHSALLMAVLTMLTLLWLGGIEQARAQSQWTTNGTNISNTNSGDVGVGTTTPNGGTVQIQSATADNHLYISSVAPDLVLGNNTTRASATAIGFMGLATAANHFGTGSAAGDLLVGVTQSNKLHWVTNGSIRATVDGSGNVGIGTTGPGAKLEVQIANAVGDGIKVTDAGAAGKFLYLGEGTSASGVFSPYIATSSSANWGLLLEGGVPTDSNTLPAVSVRGNVGGAALANSPIFTVATTTGSELFRVGATGNVGIGTTSFTDALTGTDKLKVVDGSTTFGFKDLSGQGYAVISNGTMTGVISHLNNTEGVVFGSASNHNLSLRTNNIERVAIDTSGNVGIGTTTPGAKLDVNGNTNITGTLNATGAITGGTINAKYQDVAEWVPATHALPAGTVVVLNPNQSNQVMASATSYDTRVAGVVSEKPGLALGEAGANKVLVATTGRVKVKVDASRAPINVGDLLVTSDIEGVAMKSEPLMIQGRAFHSPGTLIGKALEPLANGTGEILVLLSLQ